MERKKIWVYNPDRLGEPEDDEIEAWNIEGKREDFNQQLQRELDMNSEMSYNEEDEFGLRPTDDV